MNDQRIGEKLKELRVYYGLSQKELSEDICTQAYISQVEAGNKNVASDILYQLSERLGVDVNYILFASYHERYEYIMDVEQQARTLVEMKDYRSLMNLIEAEENGPLLGSRHFHQFILWHKAIAVRYLEKDLDKALLLLQDALTLAKTSIKAASEREVQILSNMGSIYAEKGDYHLAITYYETGLQKLWQMPVYEAKSETGLLYNLARVLLMNQQAEESLACCDKAIALCKSNLTFHGLGESYFIQGHCHKHLGDAEKAEDSFMHAKRVFELIDHQSFVAKVDQQLAKLQDA
ncbi:tetratricopeptide (TPR) repeat protein [Alkalibacillus flavidus]|uniref:Tetratricopeptide (TPR) repeat protein n=1 Tax=Alkalibacillus flavidus TaxID=546021 RepID=A0ABV2KV19_9BACI